MNPLKICLWQYSPSIHQEALVVALKSKVELLWLMETTGITDERAEMGWSIDFMLPDIIITRATIDKIILDFDDDCTHIFGGTRASHLMRYAYKQLIKQKAKIYVQTEAPNYFGFKGKIRVLRGIYENLFEYRKLRGIFAIGSLGIKYYQMILFPRHKIFPFGYFIKSQTDSILPLTPRNESSKFQIVFVGRLVKGKGVLNLIKAIENIKGEFLLRIIGNGIEEKTLKSYVKNRSLLSQKVIFYDFMKNEEAIAFMKKADLVVLPSISKDGWGAVISEALMHGTPVIATEKCGSSMLLSKSLRGEVVTSGSINSLNKAIAKRIDLGKISKDQRNKILEWSKGLSGEIAAQYMIDCIKDKKPANPWI